MSKPTYLVFLFGQRVAVDVAEPGSLTQAAVQAQRFALKGDARHD
jgi:hypothetical protein